VHLDVRLLWQWGKRDSPIVGRITDAAQIGRAKLRRYVVLAVPLHPTDLADGWLYRTSRRDGYLYLTDRAKDVIITGSSNVYPREVEEVLLTHPQVREVAVIGVPDCEWGESVCAVIVPASILRAVRIGYERELAPQV
jgi:acyl-CoA synthetase (AMP-forming)/AMP-acid ligase II